MRYLFVLYVHAKQPNSLIMDFYDKSCKLFKIKEQNMSLKDIYYNYLKPKRTSYRVKFNKTAEQMKNDSQS